MNNKKPNVLVIQTDQQNLETLSCYGGTVTDTPHIDRLANEGALFTNAFTNSAICTPSRGCLVTGCYPHIHGAIHNTYALYDDMPTTADVMNKAGYHSIYIGKWHLGAKKALVGPNWIPHEYAGRYEDTKYMFEMWHGKAIDGSPANPILRENEMWIGDIVKDVNTASFDVENGMGDETSYPNDFLCARAVDKIRENHTKPFYMMLALTDPHNPFVARPPYDKMFKPEDMPIPETFNQTGLPNWAVPFQETARSGFAPGRTDYPNGFKDGESYLRHMLSQYYGMVKHIDDCVGTVLNALEESGQLDNTIIVFTSDHGDYMGNHGLSGKPSVYETCWKTPLLIRWPEKIKAGTRISHMFSTVDFQPTLCGLLSIDKSGEEQGNDASPLLSGETVNWENAAFQHYPYGLGGDNLPGVAGIFTEKYHLAYVNYMIPGDRPMEVKRGEHVLFDRESDRNQTKNLFYNDQYKSVIKDLKVKLFEHHKKVNSQALIWLKEVDE